ncbi:hypothetical protein [Lentilitoribacter sp. EG35]|uniref:hypothetical protein n=1 Tax=Lentilitoribacter sp. EG35 TaxID=3234192 RepID=UPI00345FCF77
MTVPVDVGFKNESKCCGGSPTENTNACCLEDEKAKKWERKVADVPLNLNLLLKM